MIGVRRSAIGVDVGTWMLRAAQVDLRTRDVVGWVAIPRLTPGVAVDRAELCRLRSVLDRRGMMGDRIVMAAPHDVTSSAVLDLPPRASGAPIERLALVEMARLHRCEPGALEAASWDVPFGGKVATQCAVMASACPSEVVLSLVDAASDAGLLVEAIDLECLALHRAVRVWGTVLAGTEEVTGEGSGGARGGGGGSEQAAGARASRLDGFLIDLGATSGRLSVVSGGAVVMERQLGELAIGELVERLADELRLEPRIAGEVLRGLRPESVSWRRASDLRGECLDELASQIAEAVRESGSYVSGRSGDLSGASVWLAGWGAALAGIGGRVVRATSRACGIVSPSGGGMSISSEHSLAAGLACWEIDGELTGDSR